MVRGPSREPCYRFGQGAEKCLLVQGTAARHKNAQPDKCNPTQLTSQALWAVHGYAAVHGSPGDESWPSLLVEVGIKRNRLWITSYKCQDGKGSNAFLLSSAPHFKFAQPGDPAHPHVPPSGQETTESPERALWPSLPHCTDGKTEAQRREGEPGRFPEFDSGLSGI